jgi:hypothetical protein
MKLFIFVLFSAFSVIKTHPFMETDLVAQAADLKGAWRHEKSGNESSMICSGKYFSVASYDVETKKFIGTHGGSYRLDGTFLIAHIEFDSNNPERVGKEVRHGLQTIKGAIILTDGQNMATVWKQLDNDGPGELAGAWLITVRVREGQFQKMEPGARRTMKILSGTRFQWIAYNVETKNFSGTGGGTYTTINGKYTENILFFSRDSSRVGATLTFDYLLEDGNWSHQGLSSKGDAIHEIWTKRETIGF